MQQNTAPALQIGLVCINLELELYTDFQVFRPVWIRKLTQIRGMRSVGMLCWNADLKTQNVFSCPTQYTSSYTGKNR